MLPLPRKFYKEQSFFFFNVKSSLRGSKSLKCQEISPHLIKSSFTPNRIATVSYRLFLICLENTFSDDARWNTIQKIFYFFSSRTLGSLSHVMKIKALSAHRISEYLTICTCLHLYTQRHVYTGYISSPWRMWPKLTYCSSFFIWSPNLFPFHHPLFYFLSYVSYNHGVTQHLTTLLTL